MALLLSHVIQRPSEGLHDMEPIHRDLGIGKLCLCAAEEGGRHITDHLEYLLRLALVFFQEDLELLKSFLAFARGGE